MVSTIEAQLQQTSYIRLEDAAGDESQEEEKPKARAKTVSFASDAHEASYSGGQPNGSHSSR